MVHKNYLVISGMIYVCRHFIRIDQYKDYKNIVELDEIEKWNDYSFANNPFLIKNNHKLVDKIFESLEQNPPDVIICSPFLRCIQTAQLLNKSKLKIFVDFRFAEWNTKMIFENNLYNTREIYNQSVDYIGSDNGLELDNGIELYNDSYAGTIDESKGTYHKRIQNAITSISTDPNLSNKTILIVTHGDSLVWYNKKTLKYGELIKVE